MDRILAVSDIHGCHDDLTELLEIVEYNSEKDKLVIIGDLCDRGHQNMYSIFLARELVKDGATVVMGNHDKVAYLSMKELLSEGYGLETQTHVNCLNGNNTYNEFMNISDANKKIARNFLGSLPLYYEYDKYIFVHAGVNPRLPLEENTEESLLWSREEFYGYKAYEGKVVIFGHTPTAYMTGIPTTKPQEIWFDPIHEDKIGIDCGCVFFGRMGCLEIDLKTGEYKTHYTK